jgi:exopolyphosphatase/guanosine-5'-triphosphate,3'-diphosphate pyrophosphatase
MSRNVAVIDFGTNTFHMLIARAAEKGVFEVILKESRYVHLAEQGLQKISIEAFNRAVDTAVLFRKLMDTHQVTAYRATATAAMRSAENGPALASMIEKKAQIKPEVISGEHEAELITKGVLHVVPVGSERWLIMDIGGGSVEFVIGEQQNILFKASYPVGVGVLKHKFDHGYPVTLEDRERMVAFLRVECQGMVAAVQQFRPGILIGASGTFDVLAAHISAERVNPSCSRLSVDRLQSCFDEVYEAEWELLVRIHWVPEERRKLIASAFCLIEFVLSITSFEAVYTSGFAIKEGLLLELLGNNH